MELRIHWKGVAPQSQPITQMLTYSPRTFPQREILDPLSGTLEDVNRTFTHNVGAILTTQLEAPNATKKLHTPGLSFEKVFFRLWFQKPRRNKFYNGI